MQLKYPFDLQTVGEDNVAVPVWTDKPVFEGIITLNDTGAFIFENLKEDISEEELTRRVTEHFTCSAEDAAASVRYILKGLQDAKLLNE